MNIILEDQQVHVWQVNLETNPGHADEFSLSADELERANKFRFSKDRDNFILRHYFLREILGKYCDCKPYEIDFSYNTCKKPFIKMPEFAEIKFSLSYSNEMMLVGVSKKDIGIDIEQIREEYTLDNIAAENFSDQEFEYYESNLSEKTKAFYNIWTRKEAFIKSVGDGMSMPLKSFCVNINYDGNPEPVVIFDHPTDSGKWITERIKTLAGYIASVAVKSNRLNLIYNIL
jgi:4'-phosphopantetheinyl transferase